MKTFQLRFKFVFIVIVIFSMLLCACWTAKRDVSLRDFLKELTVTDINSSRVQSVVWLPFEFNVRVPRAAAKTKTGASLKPYLIFLVTCSADSGGRQTYSSWSQIQNRAFLEGSFGRLEPLTLMPAEFIPQLEAIRMAVADNGGSVANSHIIIFDINDPNGKPLINTAKKDKLTLVLEASDSFGRAQFTWHTPFDAIIDAPNCSKCGEKIKASWYYCPWCGNKL